MYRTVVYFGLVVIVFSIFGLIVPQSLSALTFLIPNGIYAWLSLLLGILLMHFGVAAYFRKRTYKIIFGVVGIALVGGCLFGVVFPTYVGVLHSYARMADLSVLLIAGMGCLVASLEYSRPSLFEELTKIYQNYWLIGQTRKSNHRSAVNVARY